MIHSGDYQLDIHPQLPQDRSVPIGCIGAGFIMADCQLPAYLDNGLTPVGIASRTKSSAESVAVRHGLKVYESPSDLLSDSSIPVIDIAVPPDVQIDVIREAVRQPHIRGILAQKPLGMNLQQAREIVEMCEAAGVTLVVNQNMRYDQSVRAAKSLLNQNALGDPVFATIEMRAVPHWMPWQERLGWLTLRVMSIHHLDTFRYWFGNPQRVFASTRTDPRTKFPHQDGICTYILEYENGLRVSSWDDVWAGPIAEGPGKDHGINWRIEGTTGLARGTIGWPDYPARSPSTLDFITTAEPETWHQPRWNEVWFPDAFAGPMCELLRSLETGHPASLNARDNLWTMALVDACYQSAEEHRAIELAELMSK
ncbi:Gfo/Idh/MocA family protein [Rubinisphaera margarita]|uniref:Gfo/Idh/MocA family protein n=1 Tax=Rubinisphaera margarita TaxID=2909586 RepID=UPI001EE86AAC|nr:Gfo/Idh/MocA family oxidoreductase [Rubinisphaera margarita]MCG6157907.1 Gfo/Idh/MocA family oxidoreductase [Rubinisphaera margarita]